MDLEIPVWILESQYASLDRWFSMCQRRFWDFRVDPVIFVWVLGFQCQDPGVPVWIFWFLKLCVVLKFPVWIFGFQYDSSCSTADPENMVWILRFIVDLGFSVWIIVFKCKSWDSVMEPGIPVWIVRILVSLLRLQCGFWYSCKDLELLECVSLDHGSLVWL